MSSVVQPEACDRCRRREATGDALSPRELQAAMMAARDDLRLYQLRIAEKRAVARYADARAELEIAKREKANALADLRRVRSEIDEARLSGALGPRRGPRR